MEHYIIRSWEDLTQCKSNTIPEASIQVSSFGNQQYIKGIRVTVYEPTFGVLYSSFVQGVTGLWIVSEVEVEGTSTILQRLQQLGFDVHWSNEPVVNQVTKDFLKNYRNLGYADLIKLIVNGKRVIVAYDANTWTIESTNIEEIPSSALILNNAKNYFLSDFSWLRAGVSVSIQSIIE